MDKVFKKTKPSKSQLGSGTESQGLSDSDKLRALDLEEKSDKADMTKESRKDKIAKCVPYKDQRINAKFVDLDNDNVFHLIIQIADQPIYIKVKLHGIMLPREDSINNLEIKAARYVRSQILCFIQIIDILDIELMCVDTNGCMAGKVYPPKSTESINNILVNNGLAKHSIYTVGEYVWTDKDLTSILDTNIMSF